MSVVNPYAPPGSPGDGDEVPDAPRSTGWKLDGGRLMVRQDAQLPMVDPFNGIAEERMTLRSLQIRYSPSWHRMTLAGTILGLAGGGFFRLPHGLSSFFLISGAVALILHLVAGVFLSSVRIRAFTTRGSNLKARMGNLINAMMAVMLASLMFVANSGRVPPAASTGIAVLFGLSLIAAISFRMLTWKLKCRKKTGDRYEIRGLHPDALRFLGERFPLP